MKVAKLVMSSDTDEQSSPNTSTIRVATRAEICSSASASTACIASQNRRWSSAEAAIRVNRSPAVVFHQSANPRFEHGSTTRLAAASARYVPTDSGSPGGRATTSSTAPATSRRVSIPHTAARSPNHRCRVRAGSIASAWACIAAAISAAVPR